MILRHATARAYYARWIFVGRDHHGCIARGFKCDTSILTLAWLDAWMFCACLMGLHDIVPPPPQRPKRRPAVHAEFIAQRREVLFLHG